MNKKILFFIIFIIIISFIGNLARKTYIIYKYDKQMKEYSQITNFHQKYKISNNIEIETWRKDNISLYKRSSEDGTRLIYKDYNQNIVWIISDIQINGKEIKSATKVNDLENLLGSSILYNELGAHNIGQYIQLAFTSSISSQNFYGMKCYEIKLSDNNFTYINKNNYLCTGITNNNNTTILIESSFNDITDENVALPDLSNFEIIENN